MTRAMASWYPYLEGRFPSRMAAHALQPAHIGVEHAGASHLLPPLAALQLAQIFETSSAQQASYSSPSGCGLTFYVYPHANLTNLFSSAQFADCLPESAACSTDGMSETSKTTNQSLTLLQYTAEVLIWNRILQRCHLTADPESADGFLVPFWLGSGIVSGWDGRRPDTIGAAMQAATTTALATHLSPATASKHIFLCTVDVEFVPADNLTRHSVWVNLGDDDRTWLPNDHSPNVMQLERSVTVPFRISPWLRSADAATRGEGGAGRRRDILLWSNVNVHRHPGRVRMNDLLLDEADGLGRTDVRIEKQQVLAVAELTELATRSTYCLCPTGDSKGFATRFWLALAHGCVPVYVDLYERPGLNLSTLQLPFRHAIDWERAAVAWPMSKGLVAHLVGRPPPDREYLSRVRDMVLYRNAPGDAADVAIESIAKALGIAAAEEAIRPRAAD